MKFFIFIGVLFCAWFNWEGSYWHPKWAVLLAVSAVYYSYLIGRKTHWSVGLTLCYTLLSGLWIAVWPDNQYAFLTDPNIIRTKEMELKNLLTDLTMERNTLLSIFCVVSVTSIFSIIRRKTIPMLVGAFSYLCLFDSLLVIYEALNGATPFERGGFFGNASINSTFIAILWPIYALEENYKNPFIDTPYSIPYSFLYKFLAGIPILAIMLSGSSMGFLTLCVGVATYFCFKFYPRLRYPKTILLGLSGASLLAGRAVLGPDLWSDSGRLAVIKNGWKFLTNTDQLLLGVGQGTTQIFLPSMLHRMHLERGDKTGYYFFFFHSDWFQILWEQGIIGVALFSIMVYFVLMKLWKQPILIASAMAYCFAMVGNFPLHISLPSVYGALLVLVAHRGIR